MILRMHLKCGRSVTDPAACDWCAKQADKEARRLAKEAKKKVKTPT